MLPEPREPPYDQAPRGSLDPMLWVCTALAAFGHHPNHWHPGALPVFSVQVPVPQPWLVRKATLVVFA